MTGGGSIKRSDYSPLLSVEDLKVHFRIPLGTVKAVDGVSFDLAEGETLAIVGESGSGKSVTSLAVMGLLPGERRNIVGGDIRYGGRSLLALRETDLLGIRGGQIAMIFQEPMTSLNPVFTIGAQIAEAARIHLKMSSRQAMGRALEMLELVGIPEPRTRLSNYPHELSGGMRQRAMIAMALSCNPKLLIADEPTTALDVTIQAQILDLIRKLQSEMGMSVLFITHDLGVVAEMADRVVVMYSGRVVEQGTVHEVLTNPLMPYTIGLLDSIPRRGTGGRQRLKAIPGNVPNPIALPSGCSFHSRCRFARAPDCVRAVPALEAVGPGRLVRCALHEEIAGRVPQGELAQA